MDLIKRVGLEGGFASGLDVWVTDSVSSVPCLFTLYLGLHSGTRSVVRGLCVTRIPIGCSKRLAVSEVLPMPGNKTVLTASSGHDVGALLQQ